MQLRIDHSILKYMYSVFKKDSGNSKTNGFECARFEQADWGMYICCLFSFAFCINMSLQYYLNIIYYKNKM